jgi:hypothetical protein
MQRRGKHTSITTEELSGNGVFCWVRVEAMQRGTQMTEKSQDKAQPNIEHIRVLNLAAVKLPTVQVTKLPL